MKKMIILFLALLPLALSACGTDNDTPSPSDTPAQTQSPIPSPADFADTDLSGYWYVSEIIDSNGVSLSEAEKKELGAGFTMELLSSGSYFVYDETGKALGQGTYSVTLDQLKLTAASEQVVYEILDVDTIRVTQPDMSVTVMKRTDAVCSDTEYGVTNDGTGDTE